MLTGMLSLLRSSTVSSPRVRQVLRKERELEDARLKLAALRRAKYGEGGESEGEGYLSGYDSSTRSAGRHARTPNIHGFTGGLCPRPASSETFSLNVVRYM